ncbi:hypothetical protein O3P69_011241 [Scylla paramamosain]|uniref:C2H2-type domain-containing protein n=1 Tax=Scylla paramamosain TaxID=85552 RepID=A0AAW0SU94_SCYPA
MNQETNRQQQKKSDNRRKHHTTQSHLPQCTLTSSVGRMRQKKNKKDRMRDSKASTLPSPPLSSHLASFPGTAGPPPPPPPPPPVQSLGSSNKLATIQSPPSKVEREEDEGNAEEGERAYRCEVVGCGRAFCRNEELTRHLRIHSGHRPFTCQKCGRRFVRRDHLTKHQRTHLPTHVKRSYTCPLPACTHRYTRSDALTRHMWTAHHVRARQPTRASRPRTPGTSLPRPHTTTTTTTTMPVLKKESISNTPPHYALYLRAPAL